MKLKLKLASTLLSMTLAFGVMAFAVWAASTQTLVISNTVSFVSVHVLATVEGVVVGAEDGSYLNYLATTTTAQDEEGALGVWNAGNMRFASENEPITLTITVTNNSLERMLSIELVALHPLWNGANLEGSNLSRFVSFSVNNASPIENASYASGTIGVEPTRTASIEIELSVTDTGKSITAFDNAFTMTLRNNGTHNVEEWSSFVVNPESQTIIIPASTPLTLENMPDLTTEEKPALYGFYLDPELTEKATLPYESDSDATLYFQTGTITSAVDLFEFSPGEMMIQSKPDAVASGDIVVPLMYQGKPVTKIGDFAMSAITSLTIPASVKKVDTVFWETPIREFIVDESSLYFKTVDGVLFSKDGSVLQAYPQAKFANFYEVPSGVKIIEKEVFTGMNFEEIVLPEGVEEIGKYAFEYMTNLETLNLPNSIRKAEIGIASLARLLPGDNFMIQGSVLLEYRGNEEVNDLTIPEGVKVIAPGVFQALTNLNSVSLPESIVSIEEYAFSSNSNISQLTIPPSLQYLDARWIGNKNVTLNISIENPHLTIEDGVLYNHNKTSLLRYPSNKTNEFFALPQSVQTIEDYAFWNSKLVEVDFSENLVSIGEGAFESCPNLLSIELPNSVASIGWRAFASCVNLESIAFSNGLHELSLNCLANCNALSQLTLPENLYVLTGNLPAQALVNPIALPQTLTLFQSNLFECVAMSEVVFLENIVVFSASLSELTNKIIIDSKVMALNLRKYDYSWIGLVIDEGESIYFRNDIIEIDPFVPYYYDLVESDLVGYTRYMRTQFVPFDNTYFPFD